MPKIFANIKWIGGNDDGKVTVGVPADWIVNFNHQEFLSENFDPDESYVIEWREPGKKPAGGWPKFDGLVLDVAPTVRALERKSTNYVHPKSPRVVTPGNQSTSHTPVEFHPQSSGSRGKHTYQTPINPNKTKKSKAFIYSSSDEESLEEEVTLTAECSPLSVFNHLNKGKRKADELQMENYNEMTNNTAELATDHVNKSRRKEDHNRGHGEVVGENLRDSRQNPSGVRNENIRNDGGGDGINPQDLMVLRDLLQENIRNHRQAAQNENPDEMGIGKRGSGVKLPMSQWEAAREQRTFTSMATCLVTSLFDRETLLNSNVKGGKTKINNVTNNAPRHRALDPHILEAITVSVRKEFPLTFKKTEMHTAINVKLCTMRREERLAANAAAAAAGAVQN